MSDLLNKTNYLVLTWVLTGIATSLFATRIILRLRVFGRLLIDDGLLILAFVCYLATNITLTVFFDDNNTIAQVQKGAKPPKNFAQILEAYTKYTWATAYLFFTTIWAVKGCFLAFYDGLTQRLLWYRRAWWAIIALTILTYIGDLLVYAFIEGKGVATSLLNQAILYQFAVDFTTDVLITALPLTLALRSTIPARQKLRLAGIFSLTLLITIFSIIRFALNDPANGRRSPNWITAWSIVEMSVSVIVVCVASFRSLVVKQNQKSQKKYMPGSGSRSALASGSMAGETRRSVSDKYGAGKYWPIKKPMGTVTSPSQDRARDDAGMDVELLEPVHLRSGGVSSDTELVSSIEKSKGGLMV